MAKQVRVQWHGRRVKDSERAAAAEGLRDAVEHLLGESIKQVPHETGVLQNSAIASVDEANLRGAVSYDTPYAVRQHEEMSWQHDAGRKAKYLEDPLTAEASTMGQIIAAAIRRGLS